MKRKYGKNLQKSYSKIDRECDYEVKSAISLLRDISYTKFDQTLDVAIKLNVDPRHSDQMVRGMVNLPAGTGRTVRVAVICKDDAKIAEARQAGADLVGLEIVDGIKAGKIDFDVCIATPDVMGIMGSVAKILGPKGLMPNPKLGTVTVAVGNAVSNAKTGQVEFRVEKAGIIHAGIGKLSFAVDDLAKNAQTFIQAIVKSRPLAVKGNFIKSIYLSSTMGPALKIDISNFQ